MPASASWSPTMTIGSPGGEAPDELHGGQLEGHRVDGHDRHRDRPAVGLGGLRSGRSRPGIPRGPAARRSTSSSPARPSRRPRRGRRSARARRAARRSPPCRSSSTARSRAAAGVASTPGLEQGAPGPGRRQDVHVLLLEADRQRAGRARPARNPDACGPRIVLPPLNATRSAPACDEAAQVRPRRQVHRGVDEDRQAVRVGRRRRTSSIGRPRALGLAVEERARRRRSDRGRHLRRPSRRAASPNSTSRAPDARTRWSYGLRCAALDDDLATAPSPVSGRRSIRSGSSRASIAAAPRVRPPPRRA